MLFRRSQLHVIIFFLFAILATASNVFPHDYDQPIPAPPSHSLNQTSYLAPLSASCFPDRSQDFDIIKNEYTIYFFPGHSFDDHRCRIGRSLDEFTAISTDAYPYCFGREDVVSYWCEGMTEEVLEVVRRDEGVERVVCTPLKHYYAGWVGGRD